MSKDIVETKMNFKLKLCIAFFTSSTAFGFIAAYLHDFYPDLKGFHFLFLTKTITSTCFAVGFGIAYVEDRKWN